MRMLVWKYLVEFVSILNVIFQKYWNIELIETIDRLFSFKTNKQ